MKRQSLSDMLFDIVNTMFLVITAVIIFYPLYFIVLASVSDPVLVGSGKVILWPKEITLDGYRMVLRNNEIWRGYFNTIMYTLTGTFLNVSITLMAGFAVSVKYLPGRKVITLFFVFTAYFSGGLIPLFIVVQRLGLYNSPAVLVILGAISVFNLIITRSFFEATVSQELLDAALVDGCRIDLFFFKIVLPLSKALITVLILYYGINHWNNYFNALIFLKDRKYFPLQIILREILLLQQLLENSPEYVSDPALMDKIFKTELLKYAVILISVAPAMIVYPFLQKHFVKGVMIGAIKG